MSASIATPNLYDDMGLEYEESFAHDAGLISFIHDDMLPLTPASASFLDLGIGTGRPVAAALAAAGRRVYGVDYSTSMIALAQRAVPSAKLYSASILDFVPEPAEKTFDAAVTSMSLFNFTHADMKRVAAKVHDWVKPGGYWFLVTIESGKYGRNERMVGEEDGPDEGARMVECNFLGRLVDILLYTENGWTKLLEQAGWEVLRTKKHFFEMKGEGDDEPHYYIVARRK